MFDGADETFFDSFDDHCNFNDASPEELAMTIRLSDEGDPYDLKRFLVQKIRIKTYVASFLHGTIIKVSVDNEDDSTTECVTLDSSVHYSSDTGWFEAICDGLLVGD